MAKEATQPVAVHPIVGGRQRRVRHAVDAEQLGRDALSYPIRVLGIGQQRAFGVRVSVDESRGYDQARRIDHASGLRSREVANRLGGLSGDADVGSVAGIPRAIHDSPTGNDQMLNNIREAIELRLEDVVGSGAPRSTDVLRKEVVDEGLVAKPTPLGLAPHGVEHVGIDPNRDQAPGRHPQGGPPHAPHRPELRGRRLRDIGEINPGTPHTQPASCGSRGAR